MRNLILICLLVGFSSTPAWAQDSDKMDWKIAPYLWAVNLDGTLRIGELEQDIDTEFSDILSDLDFGAAIYGELGKGQHAIHLDYTYLRLKPDPGELPTPPFPSGSTVSSKMTINIIESAYHFRFDGFGGPEALFGARYLDIELKMTPDLTGPGPVDPEQKKAGPSWWDWFVGIRTNNSISANWDFSFTGTIGGGGSHLPWTLQAMFGRSFSNDNRLGLGVRVWGIDYDENKGVMSEYTKIDATFAGLMVGYEFN